MADSGYPIDIISIHALREESDRSSTGSTYSHCTISIHALREESDFPVRLLPPTTYHFNPRSP